MAWPPYALPFCDNNLHATNSLAPRTKLSLSLFLTHVTYKLMKQ